jgi:hypothetical protein
MRTSSNDSGVFMTEREMCQELFEECRQLLRYDGIDNKRLREWIKSEADANDTCTRDVLGEICDGCRCGKQVPNDPGKQPATTNATMDESNG